MRPSLRVEQKIAKKLCGYLPGTPKTCRINEIDAFESSAWLSRIKSCPYFRTQIQDKSFRDLWMEKSGSGGKRRKANRVTFHLTAFAS
jgi:hypothetical protein